MYVCKSVCVRVRVCACVCACVYECVFHMSVCVVCVVFVRMSVVCAQQDVK